MVLDNQNTTPRDYFKLLEITRDYKRLLEGSMHSSQSKINTIAMAG